MDAIELHPDFREFLRLLNAKGVDYLVIGGYAVNFHGYIRTTDDFDIWVAISAANAGRIVAALEEFGFGVPGLSPALFTESDRIVRMGYPPVRIEVSTTISGVTFDECRTRAVAAELDGVAVRIISLADLRRNKLASGRDKDLVDLNRLPEAE